MIFSSIILIASLLVESVILLWIVSDIMLVKRKIVKFLPFFFIGIFFGAMAFLGFFSEISYVSLFFVKIIWVILIIWVTFVLWGKRWN